MMANDTYRYLQLAGQWDAALELVGDHDPDLRAELVADRFMWQQVPVDFSIIEAASPEVATVLTARISYWHKLFGLKGGPDVDEAAVFTAAPGGWASFWLGVVQDNLHENAEAAKAAYARALELAPEDRFLESYVIRHQGGHVVEEDRPRGLAMLRRSLQLRAALGARPQVAAAQLLLARELGKDDPEARDLIQIAHETADELKLVWLQPTNED